MRLNKPLFYLTGILTFISLVLYVVFSLKIKTDFWSNLFCGIFASGLFAWIVAIISYLNERRKTLEKFYSYAFKILKNFIIYKADNTIEQKYESLKEIVKFDYLEFDNVYSDISFIFFNKKNFENYIAGVIYKKILEQRKFLDKKYNKIKWHYVGETLNVPPILESFKEIDKAFFEIDEKDIKMDDNSVCKETAFYPYFTTELNNELNGRYYEIMHPMISMKEKIKKCKNKRLHKEEQTDAD